MKKFLSLVLALIMIFGCLSIGMTAFAEEDQSEARRNLCVEIGTESMALLKNDNNVLPLKDSDKVAVFGRTQVNTINGGLGSAYVYCPYIISVLGGLENHNVKLDTELADIYKEWCAANPPGGEGNIWGSGLRYNPEMPLTNAQAAAAKERGANKAIVVLGRIPGENTDLGLGKGDYYLTDLETEMIANVAANFDDIVLVLNVGYIINLKFVEEYGIDSIVYMSLGGQEGGNAVAKILTGEEVPSGKLTDTIAYNYSDYPTSETFGGNNTQDYKEDIYVGYRYFETFDPEYKTVMYPFGYGLSYTTFDISDVTSNSDGENINVTAKVTNTGDTYSGKEVVQVYYSAPQMSDAENPSLLGNPGKELAAFAKTDLLAPGQSQTLTMSFKISDMASFDDTGVTGHENAWVLEKGNYDIFVGNSIKNAGERAAVYTYVQNETVVTEQAIAELGTQLGERLLENGEYEKLETTNPGGIVIPADGFEVPAEGVTKIEAEAFTDKTATARVEDWIDNGVEGKSIGYMRDGESVTYTLNTELAGKYRLIFRYSNAYEEKNIAEMMEIALDGGTSMTGLSLSFPQTCAPPNYFSFRDSDEVIINLPKGKTSMALKSLDNEFINIDYFTLEYIPEEAKVTDISAEGTSIVQMEDFFDSSSQVRTESFADDGSGNPGLCIAYMHTPGNYVSYKLNVAEAGRYQLKFKYANAYNQIKLENMARIWIGNVEVLGLDLTFNNTAIAGNQYHNFVLSDAVEIQLQAGMVELKVESKTSNFANLDYMQLEKISETPVLRRSAAKAVPAAAALDDGRIYMLEDVYNGVVTMEQFLSQLTVSELANLTQGTNSKISGINTNCIGGLSKYGIPAGQTADGPSGFRVPAEMEATSWPSGNLLAMSWDVDLAYRYGEAIGKEATEFGIDFWLAPGANIHRDPRGGRNFEYYSEDPVLSGKICAAEVRGVQSQRVAVTLKHFAINNTEYNRLQSNSRISGRAAREIYLKNFEIIFKEAEPWSVMSCYNSINGVKACEDYNYMTVIPRQEWGWEGFFMTDWGNNSNHLKEELAGNEIKMPSGSPSTLVSAVESGVLSRERLEENVGRMLENLMKTNVFFKMAEGTGIVHEVSATEATKIKAVEYNRASSRVGSEQCEDTDGGENPTYTNQGEYLEYKIDVAKSGTYKLDSRVAVFGSGAAFEVYVNGVLAGELKNPATSGSYQDWTDREVGEIYLPAGECTMRISITGTGMNYNYFTLTPVSIDDPDIAAPTSIGEGEKFQITVRSDASKIYLTNEKGNKMGTKVISIADGIFTVELTIGTPGEARVISAYTSDGQFIGSFVIEVTASTAEPSIISVAAPSEANRNERFQVELVTTVDLVRAKFYNEKGKVIGSRLVSVARDHGVRTSVYDMEIATAGERTLTAGADVVDNFEFPYRTTFNITIK